jgi:hypothetical protein
VESISALLRATADRSAQLGCLGLHEWAMVHRADDTRHDWPLRLGPEGTDRVVESHRISCSHFDAYRFFTPSARPLNRLSPASGDRAAYEQPGCLHANMDLYKHAFRLTPMICSDLGADCFELARDIRVLDMRAAPYDLTGLTLDASGEEWTPVKIETADGEAAARLRGAEWRHPSATHRRVRASALSAGGLTDRLVLGNLPFGTKRQKSGAQTCRFSPIVSARGVLR